MHIPLLLKNLLLSGLLNALSLAPSDKRWSDSLLSLQNTAHSGSVRSSHTGLSMPLTDRMEKMSDTRSDIFVSFRVRSVHSCGGARLSASVTEVFYENSGSRHPLLLILQKPENSLKIQDVLRVPRLRWAECSSHEPFLRSFWHPKALRHRLAR